MVGIMPVESSLPRLRLLKETTLAGRFIKRQGGADHGCEIRSEARKEQLSGTPGMTKAAICGHCSRDEIECLPGYCEPIGFIENKAGVNQRGDHQSFPVG